MNYKQVGWTIVYPGSSKIHTPFENEDNAKAFANKVGNGAKAVKVFVEDNKYQDWTIDQPCYDPNGTPVHYSGISKFGKPSHWVNGKTSFSCLGLRVECLELFTVEEYEQK